MLCLGNISKDYSIDNGGKAGLNGGVKVFSDDYKAIDAKKSLDIHRYLIKETWYKTIFGFINPILGGGGGNFTFRLVFSY